MRGEAPLLPLRATRNTPSRHAQLFTKQFLAEAQFPRMSLLGFSVNIGNSAYPLTTLLFVVIVAVRAIYWRLLLKEVADGRATAHRNWEASP